MCLIRTAFEKHAEPRGMLEGAEYLPEDDGYDVPATHEAYVAFKAGAALLGSVERVSVDMSTGDDDANRRIFATVAGLQDEGNGTHTLLTEFDTANYTLVDTSVLKHWADKFAKIRTKDQRLAHLDKPTEFAESFALGRVVADLKDTVSEMFVALLASDGPEGR